MDVKELIRKRRTVRKFEAKPISKKQLEEYIDAARLAPSAANLQPLKYVVVNSGKMNAKLFEKLKWAGYLAPNYNPKDDERPASYIVICADKKIRENGFDTDMGMAAENIVLAALSDGVGSCVLGAIDREGIRELLSLEENLAVLSVIALGYPKEEPREVVMKDSVKYYLDDNTLCVPKRSMEEILIKTL